MATISITANLRRHVECPAADVRGATVAECLAVYFESHPRVRSHGLDDQAQIRRRVVVFVGSEQIRDPARHSHPVELMWALENGHADRPPSVFGFTAVAHPTDPDVAWFVPAVKDKLRIPVGGRLVVRRTTGVDATGDVLAMGSTTGSLWVSENAGDHWETVSNNLPPVYFTRFTP